MTEHESATATIQAARDLAYQWVKMSEDDHFISATRRKQLARCAAEMLDTLGYADAQRTQPSLPAEKEPTR